MCVINVTGNGKETDKATFTDMFYSNPDGFGMMWAEQKRIRVYKTLDLHEAWNKYQEVNARVKDESPIVLHFRIGTSGVNDLTNVHPFYIDDNTWFCHNGILSEYTDYKSDLSDTQRFNQKVLKKLPPNFIENESTRKLIDYTIGTDKLVFLHLKDGVPNVTIIGEDRGILQDGMWFSNDHFMRTSFFGYGYTDDDKKETCDFCGERGEHHKHISCDNIEFTLCDKCGDTFTINELFGRTPTENEIYETGMYLEYIDTDDNMAEYTLKSFDYIKDNFVVERYDYMSDKSTTVEISEEVFKKHFKPFASEWEVK